MEEYKKFIEIFFKDADPTILNQAFEFSIIVIIIIYSVIGVIILISLWKIFKKAGEKPWKSLIPIYNYIILYKISSISPLYLLVIFLLFVPKISLIGYILWNIVDATQKALLVKKFNKSIWFIVGIILLDFVFYPILAFGDSEYQKSNGEKIEGEDIVNK